jgi:hypothetical protein
VCWGNWSEIPYFRFYFLACAFIGKVIKAEKSTLKKFPTHQKLLVKPTEIFHGSPPAEFTVYAFSSAQKFSKCLECAPDVTAGEVRIFQVYESKDGKAEAFAESLQRQPKQIEVFREVTRDHPSDSVIKARFNEILAKEKDKGHSTKQ